MQLTKKWYGEAAEELAESGVELPPWSGDGDIHGAASIVWRVGELAGDEIAQQLWLRMVVDFLTYDQAVSVSLAMITEVIRIAAWDADDVAVKGGLTEAPMSMVVVCNQAEKAAEALSRCADGTGDDRAAYPTSVLGLCPALTLPWVVRFSVLPLRFLALQRACEYIGKLGVGPVGIDREFTVVVNFPSETFRTQLSLKFRPTTSAPALHAHIPCPDIGVVQFWIQTGFVALRVDFRATDISVIQALVGLTPEMTRSEIEEALNRLAFSSERPAR